MITYTYICEPCKILFEHECSLDKYKPKRPCPNCKKKCGRSYIDDLPDFQVRLVKSEIKKLGHLAARNTETTSDDYRAELTRKNNAYKKADPEKELPSGMSRVKRPKEKLIFHEE